MAQGVYKITEQFEQALCEYTGAPYAVAVDSCSSALFLSLKFMRAKGVISIPANTYMSVPCEIIHAGCRVKFKHPNIYGMLKGPYALEPYPIIDSALRFTSGMYEEDTLMCLSFTGPRKHLKLSKGGAILTDSPLAAEWLRRARYSGRHAIPYHEDYFDMLGWNMYMLPELAARGLLLLSAFPAHNEDLELPYPDLSNFPVYENPNT